MSLPSRDPILLTPGPLTTSLETKAAMLRDWGSWDAAFNEVTADIRRKLLDVVHGQATHVCVPMQGSGTFSVEAAVNSLVPRDGHVLVLINGAYGVRFAKLTRMMGRKVSVFETADEYFDYYRRRHAFWKMYGLNLPDEVLKKIYYKNALRLIPGIDASLFPR